MRHEKRTSLPTSSGSNTFRRGLPVSRMLDELETVSGTIKHVGRARINGDDKFSIVLEENPYQIYTGSLVVLGIAREGQYVSMSVKNTSWGRVIRDFFLVPKPE